MAEISSQPVTPGYFAVPCARFDYNRLAEVYNATRVDYIVPMPMNARRMEQYVKLYDVSLEASSVIFNTYNEMVGLGMVGLRAERGWITRLGIVPEQRGKHLGLFIMDAMISAAKQRGATQMQLEVIKGNIPAHSLFTRYGFKETRELLVIRRPPGRPNLPVAPQLLVEDLTAEQITQHVNQDVDSGSWLDEAASLRNMELRGKRVELTSGEAGWMLYKFTPLQIEHVYLHPPTEACEAVAWALLYALHHAHPMQDTKVENLPALDPTYPAFQQMGYFESFRRLEMAMHF